MKVLQISRTPSMLANRTFFLKKMMHLIKKCNSERIKKKLRVNVLRLRKRAICSGCTTCTRVLTTSDRQPSVVFYESGSIMAALRNTQGKSTRGSDGIPSLPLRGVTFGTKRPVM